MTALLEMGVQTPRFRSVPPYSATTGVEAVELAESCGLMLDPWQVDTLTDSLGCTPSGKFAAFEVGVNVTRQNGKGGILEARELASIFLLGDPMVIHSAHEFATATIAMDRMEELLEEGGLTRELKPRGGISRSHGSEGFKFTGGRRIWYRTRTKGGGRGFTGDLVILDEAMILQEAFHGALMPIMSARSKTGNPQVWYTGSAVDQMFHEHGIVFARVRERGVAGDDPSLAYFEWSAEILDDEAGEEVPLERLDRAMLDRVSYWAQANPALELRIAAEHVAKELRSMHPRTFATERLGIGDWPATHLVSGEVISLDDWRKLTDTSSAMVGPVCFAFDVKPDRSSASIGVAGTRPDGLSHVEVVERGKETGWVASRLAELVAAHETVEVICDGYGPAASLVPELERLGVEVRTTSAKEHANACGALFDRVGQQALRHLDQSELAVAIKAAKQRPLGDAWAWSRKGSADISPLVAVTLALWGAMTAQPADAWVGSW